jgi:hypothetical protein
VPTELIVEIFKIIARNAIADLLKMVLVSRSWFAFVKLTLPLLTSVSFHNFKHFYDERYIAARLSILSNNVL